MRLGCEIATISSVMNTLAAGSHIGPYQIVSPIAQGGMGVVYHARQPSLQRDVAIKLLPTQFTQDAEFLARFERESRVLARLRHPNIVQVFDAGASNGQHYIVMEYLSGGTLANELAQLRKNDEALPIQKAVEIAKQIAQALDYAHAKNIVHRDIKPSNILIADDGRYVLSDFGIVTDNANTKITRTLQTLGTPEYMSPEQANGLAVDRRSDIYSLGVVLYEMLTGAPPFSGGNALSVLNKHLTAPPPSLSKIRVGIPTWLQVVVQKTLAKQPEQRYQTAAELIAALQQHSTERVPTATGPRIPKMALGIGLGVIGMLAGVGLLLSSIWSGGDSPVGTASGILGNVQSATTAPGGSASNIVTQVANTGNPASGAGPTTASNTALTNSGTTPTLAPTLNVPAAAPGGANPLVTPIPSPSPTASSGGGAVTPPTATFTPRPPTWTPTFMPKPPTWTPTFTPTPKPPTATPTVTRTPTRTPTPMITPTKCVGIRCTIIVTRVVIDPSIFQPLDPKINPNP